MSGLVTYPKRTKRRRNFIAALLAALAIGGCTTTISEQATPHLDYEKYVDDAKYVVDLSVCHGADVIRFTATGIENVIKGSVSGFVFLAAHGGSAATSVEGLIVLGVAGGVVGTGAGVVKTFENWQPGIEECLVEMGYPGSPEEQTGVYALS